MKITTHVDERLLKDAMKISGAPTKRAVIEEGLQRVLADRQHRAFARRLGTYRLSWTHDDLMRSRE